MKDLSLTRRILVPLDGSKQAEAALALIDLLPSKPAVELVLLNSTALLNFAIADTPAVILERLNAEMVGYLKSAAAKFERPGIKVRTEASIGPPAETIVAAAERVKASMIAMTTHGRSGVSRWILGSVAERVVRSATVPVLLIRSFAAKGSRMVSVPPPKQVRHILVPLDGSEMSRRIVKPVVYLARWLGARVSVLHVEKGPGSFPAFVRESKPAVPQEIGDLAREESAAFVQEEIPVTAYTSRGDPAEVILKFSDILGVNLIAMSTHGRRGPSKWVMGSVAERVLRLAKVPMLLVR